MSDVTKTVRDMQAIADDLHRDGYYEKANFQREAAELLAVLDSGCTNALAEVERQRADLATFGNDTAATENRIIDAEFAAQEAKTELTASLSREAALKNEVEELRLTILGGEDAPGYAASLPLKIVLDAAYASRQQAIQDGEAAFNAQAREAALVEAIQHIDETDWKYLDNVLRAAVRDPEDSETLIWVEVLPLLRDALTAFKPAA